MTNVHNNTTLTLEDLADKVKIVKQIREHRKLAIYEALTILDRKSCLNRQIDNFINPLKLFARGHQLNPARLPFVGHNIGNIPLVPCRYLLRSRAT